MDAELRLIEISLREMTSELLIAEQKLNECTEANATSSSAMFPIIENNDSNQEPLFNNSANTVTINDSKKSVSNTKLQDKFIPVVKAFLEQARNSFRQTQVLHREMEEKV